MDFLVKHSNLLFVYFEYYFANKELTSTVDQQIFTQVKCQCLRDAFVSKQGLRPTGVSFCQVVSSVSVIQDSLWEPPGFWWQTVLEF